jgi:hypothetical protein
MRTLIGVRFTISVNEKQLSVFKYTGVRARETRILREIVRQLMISKLKLAQDIVDSIGLERVHRTGIKRRGFTISLDILSLN